MKLLKLFLGVVVCMVISTMSTFAFAEGIKVRQVQVESIDSTIVVNASFQIDFPPELGDAVKKGIPFHFLAELNITRGRWYWFDEKPVQAQKDIRLSYQPLTQQYKVSSGGLTLSASSLNEALIQLGSIAGWQVAEGNTLEPGKTYQGEIRLRLDLAQLPKPFQINALNARDWNLSSDWQKFTLYVNLKAASNK